MSDNLLLAELKLLLLNPLIKPADRLRIEAVLPQISDDDLQSLKKAIEKKISVLSDTQSLLYNIRKYGEDNLNFPATINEAARKHPLFDLTLDDLAASIKDHLVDYLKDKVDLINELELYVAAQNEIELYDGEPTVEVYDQLEFYKKVLQALKTCQQIVSNKPTPMAVKDIIASYDSDFPSNKERGNFEQETFIHKQRVGKEEVILIREIVTFYDYLLQKIDILNSVKSGILESSVIGQLIFNSDKNKGKVFNSESEKQESASLEASKEIKTNIEDSLGQVITTTQNVKAIPDQVEISSRTTEVKAEPVESIKTQVIHSTPQALKSAAPALIFDLEDEKEADKHRDKAGQPPVLEHTLRQYIDEVIKTRNLVFKDEINRRRFVQLMVSRLKDVRGVVEIAEALRKPVEAGGLGMSEDKAEQVQNIIEQAKKEFEARLKDQSLTIPEPIRESPPPPPPKVVSPQPTFDAAAAEAWRQQMLQQLAAQSQTESPAPVQSSAVKPQLSDIKAPPRVVGPLEELRSLTLVDFRRLGDTPQEALQKIKNKIDLLGEHSVARKVEAVRAWKSSAVYQQYLRLGRESIEQGKSVSVIVANYQALGEPTLTEEEFNSIADFNAKLRF